MLMLKLVPGFQLKKVIETIKDVVKDAKFDCSATGLSMQAKDSSHGATVSFLIPAKVFVHLGIDRNISMGIDVTNMSKMLEFAEDTDDITLIADDGNDKTVTLKIETPTLDKVIVMKQKNINNNEHHEITEAKYDAIFQMPSDEFAKICKELSSIGDTVIISVLDEHVRFATVGGDIVIAEFSSGKNTSAAIIEMNEPVSLTVELRYMVDSFAKANLLADTVTISLSSMLPVLIEYNTDDTINIRFYLSSKVYKKR